ncbi:laccase-14-like isoform X2 [Cornus florida]|uniref:laccase-14-like isoform X2 n=1 Tax=Cornus florida TaxID=4283 RepID=UPI0028972A22|nr:laccase-14-like isoform X2 [Cornus florida]
MGLLKLEFLVLITLSWTLICTSQGNIKYYDFIVKEDNFTRLCVTKSMLTVNGSFPGPVLRVHKGDTVFVNVHNKGDEGVTIHWHGVKNPGNPWSDGTEHITQCAIQPGSNMTYEVKFTAEEGTLWWHAHNDWTRATVHGVIVVLPAVGTTYPFPKPDEEEIIVLAWFVEDVNRMVSHSLKKGQDFNRSNAFTINGQPGDLNPCSNETMYRLVVDHGKTYLLRILNAATNQELFFSIAQHNLTVVGLDGAYIKPIVTNYIMIAPGQTMDILVTANQSLSHYYMVARAYYSPDGDKFDHAAATAILQYRGNYTPPASLVFPTLPAYHDNEAADNFTIRFRSLASEDHPVNVPKDFTTRLYIAVSINTFYVPEGSPLQEEYNEHWLDASLNNISFNFPRTNILEAYYRNLSGIYDTHFPDEPPKYYDFTGPDLGSDNYTIPSVGTEVKVLNYNEAVEIVFQDTNVLNTSQNHPMHLHGFSFYLVGAGYGNFNNETHPNSYNLVDPPLLNTVGIPKNGWAAIRFIADNPGVWFMHCHMERHTTLGMTTALIVKNGDTSETSMSEPYPYMPECTVPLDSKLQASKFSGEI